MKEGERRVEGERDGVVEEKAGRRREMGWREGEGVEGGRGYLE